MSCEAKTNPRWPLLLLAVFVFVFLAWPHGATASSGQGPASGSIARPMGGGGPNGTSDPDELGIYSRHSYPPTSGKIQGGASSSRTLPSESLSSGTGPATISPTTGPNSRLIQWLLVELHLLYL